MESNLTATFPSYHKVCSTLHQNILIAIIALALNIDQNRKVEYHFGESLLQLFHFEESLQQKGKVKSKAKRRDLDLRD